MAVLDHLNVYNQYGTVLNQLNVYDQDVMVFDDLNVGLYEGNVTFLDY